MRPVVFARLGILIIATLAVACGGSSAANETPDPAGAEAAVVAEEAPIEDSRDTESDDSAEAAPTSAAIPALTADFEAFQACLAERGLTPGARGDGSAQVDQDTAAARQECAAEVGPDPDAGGFAGFGGGRGLGDTQILSCLGEQGVSIEGIDALADLGRGPGGQDGPGGAGQGFDAEAFVATLAERLGLDPEDPTLAGAVEACVGQFAGGFGRGGGGANAGAGDVVERVASCLEDEGFTVERSVAAEPDDAPFTGLVALAGQLGLDLTDPEILPAIQACLANPPTQGEDGDAATDEGANS